MPAKPDGVTKACTNYASGGVGGGLCESKSISDSDAKKALPADKEGAAPKKWETKLKRNLISKSLMKCIELILVH